MKRGENAEEWVRGLSEWTISLSEENEEILEDLNSVLLEYMSRTLRLSYCIPLRSRIGRL
jgi:hypothetical protein